MRRLLSLPVVLCSLALSSLALAQDPPPPDAPPAKPSSGMRVGLIAGAKIGGIVPFGGLGPNVTGGIELGYAFPFLKRALALVVNLDYAEPKSSGTENDPRITMGGKYTWHLTEQELNLMPVAMFRMTFLGRVRPYVGVGPRFYFLKSTVRSNEGMPTFMETTEKSSKVGVGVPLGVEFGLGPGALIGELLFQAGGLDHKATGASNTTGLNIAIGYRFLI